MLVVWRLDSKIFEHICVVNFKCVHIISPQCQLNKTSGIPYNSFLYFKGSLMLCFSHFCRWQTSNLSLNWNKLSDCKIWNSGDWNDASIAVNFSENSNAIFVWSIGVIFVYWFNIKSPLSFLEWVKFCIFTGLFVCSIVFNWGCFSAAKQTALVDFSFSWMVQLKYLRLLEFAVFIGETACI